MTQSATLAGEVHFDKIVGGVLDLYDAVAKMVEAMQAGNEAECESQKQSIIASTRDMAIEYKTLEQRPCMEGAVDDGASELVRSTAVPQPSRKRPRDGE